nr:unnamed protein product [Digitaria exilis]
MLRPHCRRNATLGLIGLEKAAAPPNNRKELVEGSELAKPELQIAAEEPATEGVGDEGYEARDFVPRQADLA